VSDPLAPFAGDHEGTVYGATRRGDDSGAVSFVAVCICGFVAEARPTPGAAAADLIGHRPQETP
jgi:hypothetical protein